MFCFVMGTRPEIIKMAPIVLEFKRRGLPFEILHTGQHYDESLSKVFFKELGLPEPDHLLEVGSGSQAQQTARAMVGIEEVLVADKPAVVVVEGDTNTVLAGALAGVKLRTPVAHVEAGLRSWDLRMPEEHNRRLVDHLSHLLFAPTEWAAKNLRDESVWGRIFVTGNTVLDACRRYLEEAQHRSKILDAIPHERFILTTLHRAENVDDPEVLGELVKILTHAPQPVVYPAHPRSIERLKRSGLFSDLEQDSRVHLLPPVGYFDFLQLMRHCACILTDSGGIQEEATAPGIHKKVFVVRESTERPEAVEAGFAVLAGTRAEEVLRALKESAWEVPPETPSPFGDGHSAPKIAKILKDAVENGNLSWRPK